MRIINHSQFSSYCRWCCWCFSIPPLPRLVRHAWIFFSFSGRLVWIYGPLWRHKQTPHSLCLLIWLPAYNLKNKFIFFLSSCALYFICVRNDKYSSVKLIKKYEESMSIYIHYTKNNKMLHEWMERESERGEKRSEKFFLLLFVFFLLSSMRYMI